MKKIYNDLFLVFFSLFVVIACDENNDEIVPMTYTNPVASVTNINPVEGYVGDPFTITGTNFGIRTEHVKVYIGSQEAEIVSCEDKSIVAKVPESATNGNISVEVYKQKVETELGYRVLGKPGVSSVTPSYGFPGAEIVFKGQEFALSDALYMLQFGSEDKAKIVEITNDKEFTAVVPESAVSGIISFAIGTQVIDMTSYPFTVLQHATLDAPKEGEPIPSGFAGSKFAITGTNLVQELLDRSVEGLEPLKVTFSKAGGEPVEAAIDTDNLTDKSIPLTVPVSLEAGDYTITVITPFETIGTQLKYTVLPMPTVTGISTKAGYINAEVTIIGQNFGTKAENIQVFFGETVCDKVTLNDKGNIVVNVPKGVSSEAPVKIKLIIQGREIEMGESGTFEVWETPEITSVETPYIYPYGTLVKAGQEITFTGKGFGTDKNSVTVTFEGISVPVAVKEITTTAITVTVPQGFNGGKVTMVFEGITQPVESDILQPLPADGDISQYVLMNYKQPFDYVKEGGDNGFHKKGEWAKAAYWIVQNSNLTAGEGGAAVDLAFKTKYGDGSDAGLALQTDWGFDNPKNDGKVYQTSHLQKGKYKLTAHVYEYDGRGFTGYVAVCKGNEMANTSDIPSKSLANASISGTGDVVVDILVEEPTDVVIGFVCTITVKQGRAKIDNFKLELVEQ